MPWQRSSSAASTKLKSAVRVRTPNGRTLATFNDNARLGAFPQGLIGAVQPATQDNAEVDRALAQHYRRNIAQRIFGDTPARRAPSPAPDMPGAEPASPSAPAGEARAPVS